MSKPEKVIRVMDRVEEKINKYKEESLIGMVEIDEESYQAIINFSKSLICEEEFVLKEEKYEIISIALVNFAIQEYKNGQFWHEFAIKLDLDVVDVMKICKQAIEKFCNIKELYFHIGNKNKGYVTSILTHAIIPNSSLPKFIEFLQDIYFKDLEEDYIDAEVEELVQYMHRLFTKYLEDEDIRLIVQGSKMTIARQQLPKSFRIAFVRAASIVAPIIERLLFYINQVNYGEVIEYLANDRFDEYFSDYDYTNRKLKSVSYKHRIRKENIKKFHMAQYYYENRNLYLQIPRQIIDSDYIEREIQLEIVFGDSVIHQEKMLLTKSRLFFKTEQILVQIPKFHSEISYRIKSGDKVIYSSGKVLFRNYIIFDLKGNEISPKKLTDETVKVITYAQNQVLKDDAEIDIAYVSNYRISTVFLNEESLLLINDKVLSTNVAAIKNELNNKWIYLGLQVKDSNNDVYDVYSQIPDITLRIPYRKEINDFIISFNGMNFILNEVSNVKLRTISDGSGDNLAIISIQAERFMNNNPAKIIIREKGTSRIYIEESIFILKSLDFKFDKSYYYKEKIARIIGLSSNEIELTEELKFPLKVNIKKNKVFSTEFNYDERRFLLVINIPIITWRFGHINSDMKACDNIWWEDIGDYKLYIKFPNKESKLHIVTGSNYEKIQGKKIGDEYKYSLDHLFQTVEKEPITLGVIVEGNEERITEVHFKPSIHNFSISYYDDSHVLRGLFASWSFLGKGKLYADIIYSPTTRLIKSYEIDRYDGIMDKDIELYYNEHEIVIYQLNEDDFFGEGIKKNILLHKKFIVGDPVIVKCKNKMLKGIKCISDSEKFELDNFYLKDIKFSRKRGYYEANGMYLIRDRFTGHKREWYFTKYNPFVIKPVEIGSDEISFEIVDKDEDGLIYDIKTKHINPRDEDGNESRYKLIDVVILEIMERGDKNGIKSY
ncbi:hypothetical protein [Maledivibacter halophilus]|uniref:Uncharacterized protein n=1 Tax=Maledivibacter halophilus TaxID=36842 RepID=A0A1T5LV91_9FIRM|nr:hypothetical protein [Maledivibacter halophilus]SKC79892.1 hypothetical protein SAMN02194393_03382 [Maledivibacter halophilus]